MTRLSSHQVKFQKDCCTLSVNSFLSFFSAHSVVIQSTFCRPRLQQERVKEKSEQNFCSKDENIEFDLRSSAVNGFGVFSVQDVNHDRVDEAVTLSRTRIESATVVARVGAACSRETQSERWIQSQNVSKGQGLSLIQIKFFQNFDFRFIFLLLPKKLNYCCFVIFIKKIFVRSKPKIRLSKVNRSIMLQT